jgi:hypothetical protein
MSAPLAPSPSRLFQDRTWLGLVLLALMLPAAGLCLHLADESKPSDWDTDQLVYIPSGKFLRPMALDQNAVVADFLWTRGMIYFADSYLTGKDYPWLGHILDVVTVLNPRFHPAYEFGGTVLTKNKSELPKTLRLLDRGIAEFPKEWRLRVSAALGQIALDSNYIKASEYLQPVSLEKDVPDHIRTLSATFLQKGGGRRMALAFLADSYVRSENTINREIFVEKIMKLYPASVRRNNVARKDVVNRVLHEVVMEPRVELMALGLIHEYMSDSLSLQGQKLLDMLYGKTEGAK